MKNSDALEARGAESYSMLTDFRFLEAFFDFWLGLRAWRIWTALAWQEFRSTYRRSIVGVLWVTISFFGIVFIKIVIFGSLLSQSDNEVYNFYLLLGFFIWAFLAQSVTAAPASFTSASGWIRSEPLPYSLYLYKSVTRELLNLALTSAVVIATSFYLDADIGLNALYTIPAIAFLIVNAVFIKLLLGIISARIRDITHLVAAIMTPLMFLSPVFWMPAQMSDLMPILWWNPMYHYIEIFRAPLVYGQFPWESWVFSLTLFLIIATIGFVLFARYRRRLVFWF